LSLCQFVARYNVERYCEKLPKVVSYSNFEEIIPLGYYPKLESSLASRSWPGRPDNMKLRNLERMNDGIQLAIADLELWRTRFLEAIEQGFVVTVSVEMVLLVKFSR
jgi:tyrosinase